MMLIKLALASQIFLLYYITPKVKKNLNCKIYRDGELIACRHLSMWWLNLDKFKYIDPDSKEWIKECQCIPNDSTLNQDFYLNGCPSEGIYLEINQFNEAIYNIAKMLIEGQEKRYYLSTVTHAMGLRIAKNKDNIVIYYYDPNDTLRHKKIMCHTEDDLKRLTYNDFWSPKNQQIYFNYQDKICYLLSLETKALRHDCKVVCMTNPNATLIYALSRHGHYGHSSASFDFIGFDKNTKQELLTGKIKDRLPALHSAFNFRHGEAASTLLSMIINTDLEPDVKKQLLASNNHVGQSALYCACERGSLEIVTALITAICSSDLNLNKYEKAELLSGKWISYRPPYKTSNNGVFTMAITHITTILSNYLNLKKTRKNKYSHPALYIACQNGYHKVVKTLLAAVLSKNLNLNKAAKAELLSGESESGTTSLCLACYYGHDKVVKALLAAVSNKNLNLNKAGKVALLTRKDKYGNSALYVACQNGYHKAAKTLLAAVFSKNFNFNKATKAELLAGTDEPGTPSLYVACNNGHDKVVKILLAAICSKSLNLNKARKASLLAGKNEHGNSALYIACNKGHFKIVSALIMTIRSRDLNLNKTIQEELMLGKSSAPALLVALLNGHSETVKVYLNAVLHSSLASAAKERLLTAKTINDPHPLQVATNAEKIDAIKVFINIVKKSNYLLDSEKDKILKPYNNYIFKRSRKNRCCIIL
ncbi:MAG: ankyrin repeat domain-containing protein [Candidatus Endonucleobacter sp. (ex Gigantidas childressi)]|nr:ankyrin repeat domain-containing protein [Candidatus Endonucleobacter sp. (ex Gigantidas childressi)]